MTPGVLCMLVCVYSCSAGDPPWVQAIIDLSLEEWYPGWNRGPQRPHLHTSGRHTVIGTDRGVTDSMVVGHGRGVRRYECVSEFVCVHVKVKMVTNGNVSLLPSLDREKLITTNLFPHNYK